MDPFDPALTAWLEPWLMSALLVLLRLLPIVFLTPVFGGEGTPRRYRIGLAMFLSLGLAPIALPAVLAEGASPVTPPLLIGEFLIGVTIGVLVRMVFDLLGAVGSLIDGARGAMSAQLFDPLTKTSTPPLALFFSQLALVLFFAAGGHRLLFEALDASFVAAPPGDVFAQSRLLGGAGEAALRMLGELFLIAVSLAAPVFAVLLVVDVALGLANRAAPQIQVFFLGMSIKGVVGIGVVLLTLGFGFEGVVRAAMERVVAVCGGG